MDEPLKPEEIDYSLGPYGDEPTTVIDAEGEEVFYTNTPEMADHLVRILNTAEDISKLVRRHPDAFAATPAGNSWIDGKRWPPAGNDKRTSPLERVLAYLQNALAK